MADKYRIIGAEMSPYSVKVRSYFRYKAIPHQWVLRNAASQAEFEKYAKMPIIPLVVTPEGSGIQDSTPIIERLEDRTVMSVTVGVSVDGMNTTNNSCNCQPPDTIAAAGPNHVVHMVNTAIEVFNKNGTVASAPSDPNSSMLLRRPIRSDKAPNSGCMHM